MTSFFFLLPTFSTPRRPLGIGRQLFCKASSVCPQQPQLPGPQPTPPAVPATPLLDPPIPPQPPPPLVPPTNPLPLRARNSRKSPSLVHYPCISYLRFFVGSIRLSSPSPRRRCARRKPCWQGTTMRRRRYARLATMRGRVWSRHEEVSSFEFERRCVPRIKRMKEEVV